MKTKLWSRPENYTLFYGYTNQIGNALNLHLRGKWDLSGIFPLNYGVFKKYGADAPKQ